MDLNMYCEGQPGYYDDDLSINVHWQYIGNCLDYTVQCTYDVQYGYENHGIGYCSNLGTTGCTLSSYDTHPYTNYNCTLDHWPLRFIGQGRCSCTSPELGNVKDTELELEIPLQN